MNSVSTICANCKDSAVCKSFVKEFYNMLNDKCCDNGQITIECSHLEELIGNDKL